MKAGINKRKSAKSQLAGRNEIGAQNVVTANNLAKAISGNFFGAGRSIAQITDGANQTTVSFEQKVEVTGAICVNLYISAKFTPEALDQSRFDELKKLLSYAHIDSKINSSDEEKEEENHD